ncbi:hypothetical protein JZ751_026065 [Albula glossodonta]|uniref:Uncharacterized protein n=1 Tax=Albula glossodonta TaxID=121402 RepID=A0A8T2NG31_9TELE|nr:hypothetical protein JZ751_026065 [Albula glossodonta]
MRPVSRCNSFKHNGRRLLPSLVGGGGGWVWLSDVFLVFRSSLLLPADPMQLQWEALGEGAVRSEHSSSRLKELSFVPQLPRGAAGLGERCYRVMAVLDEIQGLMRGGVPAERRWHTLATLCPSLSETMENMVHFVLSCGVILFAICGQQGASKPMSLWGCSWFPDCRVPQDLVQHVWVADRPVSMER